MLKKALIFIMLLTHDINHAAILKKEVQIVDGLAPGPISEAFDKYIKAFYDQTGVLIRRVRLGGYGVSWSEEELPEADIVFNSEFLSADLAVVLDSGRPSPYVPASDIYPDALGQTWLAGLEIQYGSSDGSKLYALPFNPSMGIVFYNKTLLKEAGILLETLPTTWDEILILSNKLKEKGFVGFSFPWTCAYTLEYGSSIQNIPLTTNQNGFTGKPKFELHKTPQYHKIFETFFEAIRANMYHHETDNSAGAETYFAKNECAMLMQGSARLETIKQAFTNANKEAEFAFGPLPYESKLTHVPYAPKIGGTGIWITRKGSKNPNTLAFLKYVSDPQNQAAWSRLSGYMPSTLESDAVLEKSGFYKTHPHVKMASEQAKRPASRLTHVRIPKYDEIRGKVFMKHYGKAITDIKQTKKTTSEITSEFLKNFSDEANTIIEKAF